MATTITVPENCTQEGLNAIRARLSAPARAGQASSKNPATHAEIQALVNQLCTTPAGARRAQAAVTEATTASRADIRGIQGQLKTMGFYEGAVDGIAVKKNGGHSDTQIGIASLLGQKVNELFPDAKAALTPDILKQAQAAIKATTQQVQADIHALTGDKRVGKITEGAGDGIPGGGTQAAITCAAEGMAKMAESNLAYRDALYAAMPDKAGVAGPKEMIDALKANKGVANDVFDAALAATKEFVKTTGKTGDDVAAAQAVGKGLKDHCAGDTAKAEAKAAVASAAPTRETKRATAPAAEPEAERAHARPRQPRREEAAQPSRPRPPVRASRPQEGQGLFDQVFGDRSIDNKPGWISPAIANDSRHRHRSANQLHALSNYASPAGAANVADNMGISLRNVQAMLAKTNEYSIKRHGLPISRHDREKYVTYEPHLGRNGVFGDGAFVVGEPERVQGHSGSRTADYTMIVGQPKKHRGPRGNVATIRPGDHWDMPVQAFPRTGDGSAVGVSASTGNDTGGRGPSGHGSGGR